MKRTPRKPTPKSATKDAMRLVKRLQKIKEPSVSELMCVLRIVHGCVADMPRSLEQQYIVRLINVYTETP